jgi:leucyl/phenylalanyl-tRNA--protein transferase
MLRWQDVLAAYSIGMFPMADPSVGTISWYAPDPRGVIDVNRCIPTRSLRRTIRSGVFEVRWNSDFHATIRHCAAREETWISGEIIDAYSELHARGWAHCVECWREGSMRGGLYGVAMGSAFFGESMFSNETDASKVALMSLAQRLRERGFTLLDAQFLTPHLAKFGAVEIPREEYMERLSEALSRTCSIHP